MRLRCRVSKFRRISVILLLLSIIYVVVMIFRLMIPDDNDDVDEWSDNQRIFELEKQTADGVKVVKWKTTYWLPILERDEGDYDDVMSVSDDDSSKYDTVRVQAYKGLKSEIISLKRRVRDTRPVECRSLRYSEYLPPVSIIIVFHNEYIGVILRSLISILHHTPRELINEIILIDDGSTENYLQESLEIEVNQLSRFLGEIRIVRNRKRKGANWALLQGVEMSTSETVVLMSRVLDVQKNWLPPLVQPLTRSVRIATVPVHEYIHHRWNESQVYDKRGVFDLELNYVELPRVEENIRRFESPIMQPNAVFAINKQFLKEIHHSLPIGGQDGNLLELSLKIWMCKGRIFKVPCSRVIHNFKESGLHDPNILNKLKLDHELVKTVKTWFDDGYQNHVINFTNRFSNVNLSSLNLIETGQRQVCRPFSWFLNKVAPDLATAYFIQPKVVITGAIESIGHKGWCLQTTAHDTGGFLMLKACSEAGVDQMFSWTANGDWRPKNSFYCFEAFDQMRYHSPDLQLVALQACSFSQKQQFNLNLDGQSMKAISSDFCLDVLFEKKFVYLSNCSDVSVTQKWQWIV